MKHVILLTFLSIFSISVYAQGHFVLPFTGYGHDHMDLYIMKATINGVPLEAGDEIAAFDGTICCGKVILTQPIDSTNTVTFGAIAASETDVGSSNGYTVGDAITYKLWDSSKSKEIPGITAVYYDKNTGLPLTALTYTIGASAYLKLSVTTTWNGNAWSISTPTSSDDAIIDGSYNGAVFSCNNLTINAGKQVTITTGTLSIAGKLLLKCDAINGPATFLRNGGTLSVTGTTTVEQYLTGAGGTTPNGRYWYIASPLTNASSSNFDLSSVNPLNALWSFSETNYGYTRITSGSPVALAPGKGYVALLGGNKTAALSGTALNDGNVTIVVTRASDNGLGTNSKRGYNLIGNPYPSYLNINTAFNNVGTTRLESSIWYRSYNSGSGLMAFDTYNAFTGASISLGTDGPTPTNFIPPMQAFWVRANTDGVSGTLALTNAMRSHQTSGNKLRSAEVTDVQKIRLQISNGQAIDQTLIEFYPGALDAFDNFDSHKLSNDNVSIPEIYTFAGSDLVAINGMAPLTDSKELAIGFKTGKAGTFSIKASEILNFDAGQVLLLKDKKLNISQNLTENPEYSFTSDSVNTSDRFSLVIGKIATGLEVVSQESLDVYSNINDQIGFIWTGDSTNPVQIAVYTVLGQKLISTTFTGSTILLNRSFRPGVYIVKAYSEGYQVSRKVIINK